MPKRRHEGDRQAIERRQGSEPSRIYCHTRPHPAPKDTYLTTCNLSGLAFTFNPKPQHTPHAVFRKKDREMMWVISVIYLLFLSP